MSAVVNPLETRVLLLERRVVELERRLAMSPQSPARIGPETLAIIAVAVAEAGYGRIKYATRVSHAAPPTVWAGQGRQEHFYSHRVR
jgi:hypothetical protein